MMKTEQKIKEEKLKVEVSKQFVFKVDGTLKSEKLKEKSEQPESSFEKMLNFNKETPDKNPKQKKFDSKTCPKKAEFIFNVTSSNK